MDRVFGLPLHPLVVHGTVVLVPAAATGRVGLAALVQVVLVGDSGAQATWSTGTPVHAAGRPVIVDR